jgi:uncharacterized protein (TIGR03067 family)
MIVKVTLPLLMGLMLSIPTLANDGWYRFPAALQGKWKIAQATVGDQNHAPYLGQIAEIDGSTILLQTDNASNRYQLTYVKPEGSQIELDLTATSPGGGQVRRFRCLLAISDNQLRLCRPQNDSHPRPRDINQPERSETLFTLVRESASSKP